MTPWNQKGPVQTKGRGLDESGDDFSDNDRRPSANSSIDFNDLILDGAHQDEDTNLNATSIANDVIPPSIHSLGCDQLEAKGSKIYEKLLIHLKGLKPIQHQSYSKHWDFPKYY